MSGFSINSKPSVLFGENSFTAIGKKLKGCKKVLCIYDKGVKSSGIADKIIGVIEQAGIKAVCFDGVLPDPPDYIVDAAAELGRDEEVDAIVAIGGGSAMDTAKGVNILLTNPGKISDWILNPKYKKSDKPLIMIPTTAGTGSDITNMGVITVEKENRKAYVIGPSCVATLSIIDPALTLSLPPYPTAATGMDTLAHAVEAITTGFNQNLYSATLAQKAISMVVQNLPAAVENGSDIKARENMSMACLLAGVAFCDAIVHIGHGIAHSIGAKYHIPHGTACALSLPSVIKFVADAIPENVKMVADAMGLKLKDDIAPAELGKTVGDAIFLFGKKVGIPSIKDLKVSKTDFDEIAELTMKDLTFTYIPKKAEKSDILAILEDMYEYSA